MNDPRQAAVDTAVAAMVASNSAILTAPGDRPFGDCAPVAPPPVPDVPQPDSGPAQSSERLRLALARRSAFRAALGALRARGKADVEPIQTAIANADVDAIVTSTVAHAVGLFLDENLGRPDTLIHGLNVEIEQEIVAAVYADPDRILGSVLDDGSPDAVYVRRLATEATTLDHHLFDIQGQPTRPKVPTLSMLQTVLAR